MIDGYLNLIVSPLGLLGRLDSELQIEYAVHVTRLAVDGARVHPIEPKIVAITKAGIFNCSSLTKFQ